MALFQNSVLNRYLKLQDAQTIEKAYATFTTYFHNAARQQNIREAKEEQFQEGFLRELFVNVLDYTLNPEPHFNLTTELKNEKGAKKADGAILKEGQAIAVIELKSTKTKDLESIRQQAFDYKANQTGCVYVVTSNFEKLRFYVNNAVEFEEFNLFNLTPERFALLYLCLHQSNVINHKPLEIKNASIREEENITKQFYTDYSVFKRELYRDLVKLNVKNEVFREELINQDADRATKNIKLTLFKKSQKLIDRFLFIFFGEDRGLLPPNSTIKILEQWNKLKELDEIVPLYSRFIKYFNYLDKGRKGTDNTAEIFAYNGGLFKPDPVLDSMLISDELLYKHTKGLSLYNFDSQIDVNILGHIFENSLNEIESVNAEIEGVDFDKQTTKRKKDGVFYTPKYITKYIVDNTVGKLCTEKKTELGIIEEAYFKSRKGRTTKKLKELQQLLNTYRDWLLTLTILDPACGSGAFLNQALDFLIKEHQYIDELDAKLTGSAIVFRNIENTVLENNIYGVDLNEESVEIAKLSLWLRTAQPRRQLTTLSSNIKCGNSLIDDPKVAGAKAFNWQQEFPHVFKAKEKVAYHITTSTHDSRTSQRMIDHKVRLKRDGGARPKAEAIWLEANDEILITETIASIVKEDGLNVMAYNICGDHIHLLLVCEEEDITRIVGKIKAITSKEYNTNKGITTRGHVPLSKEEKKTYNSLWTQKFGCKEIKSEDQLWNTVEYIKTNRQKHELPSNKKLQHLADKICSSYDYAFRTETKGGFDVVIGNPPYGARLNDAEKEYIRKQYQSMEGDFDTYIYFMELTLSLLAEYGECGLIIPNNILLQKFGRNLRELLLNTTSITSIIDLGYGAFEYAVVPTTVITYSNTISKNNRVKFLFRPKRTDFDIAFSECNQDEFIKNQFFAFNVQIAPEEKSLILKMEKRGSRLEELCELKIGIECTPNYINDKPISTISKPMVRGRNFNRYRLDFESDPKYVEYEKKLLHRAREERLFDCPKKILIRQTGDKVIGTIDMSRLYAWKSVFVILPIENELSLEYILGLLNSKTVNFYYQKLVGERGRAFAQIKGVNLKPIPLIVGSTEEQTILASKVDEALLLGNNFLEADRKFRKYLQSQFALEKLPKKLQNWHGLNFGEFITELNKAIKKCAKGIVAPTTMGHVPLAKLTKTQEMDWMEVFETKKAEAQTLKAEIDKTDAEIDAMVYELYGLSEEEIRIVEGS